MRPWGVLLCLLAGACRPAAEPPTPGPLALEAWWKDLETITSVTGIAFRNPSNAPESLDVTETLASKSLSSLAAFPLRVSGRKRGAGMESQPCRVFFIHKRRRNKIQSLFFRFFMVFYLRLTPPPHPRPTHAHARTNDARQRV